MQSKKRSLVESVSNTMAGFALSWLAGYFILPYFGVEQSVSISFQITIIYTFISLFRNYVVRRAFNKLVEAL